MWISLCIPPKLAAAHRPPATGTVRDNSDTPGADALYFAAIPCYLRREFESALQHIHRVLDRCNICIQVGTL